MLACPTHESIPYVAIYPARPANDGWVRGHLVSAEHHHRHNHHHASLVPILPDLAPGVGGLGIAGEGGGVGTVRVGASRPDRGPLCRIRGSRFVPTSFSRLVAVLTGSPPPVVREFLGIPFGVAPVGPLRFLPPVKKPKWHLPYEAKVFGPACYNSIFQIDFTGGNEIPVQFPPPISESEDCVCTSPSAARRGNSANIQTAVAQYLGSSSGPRSPRRGGCHALYLRRWVRLRQ